MMGTSCRGGTEDLMEDTGGPDRTRGRRRVKLLTRGSSFPAHVSSTPGDTEDSRRQDKEDVVGTDRIRAYKRFMRSSSFPATELSTSSASSSPSMETCISCITFNILAPIFKKVGDEGCLESQFRDAWLKRNVNIIDLLLRKPPSIICLQEFWLENKELVDLYEERLGHAGYLTFKLARTSDKGDGLLTAIKCKQITVLNYRELQFYDRGDRVAQIFHLFSTVPFCQTSLGAGQQLLLVNTHLLFPHNSSYCLVRLWQVYKIIECLEQFKVEHGLASIPVILCGDLNGSKHGHVYKFLCSQGFVSSYDSAHKNDAQQWVSHWNHRGNICGVDFIWLRNPSKHQQSLSSSWKEAVFNIIIAMLCEAGIPQDRLDIPQDLLDFFQPEENPIKLSLYDFQKRLHQRELTRNHLESLSREEIKRLMHFLYADANDLVDRSVERMVALPSMACESNESRPLLASGTISESSVADAPNASLKKGGALEETAGLTVQDAFFFPREVQQGVWPEDYDLSDHALLTAIFKLPRDVG